MSKCLLVSDEDGYESPRSNRSGAFRVVLGSWARAGMRDVLGTKAVSRGKSSSGVVEGGGPSDVKWLWELSSRSAPLIIICAMGGLSVQWRCLDIRPTGLVQHMPISQALARGNDLVRVYMMMTARLSANREARSNRRR
jgi:hypothetical protein